MSTIPSGFPISLKSWQSNTKTAVDLPTFFQRVNFERGGLTKLTEESLRGEIRELEVSRSQGVEDEQSEDGGVEVEEAGEEKGKVATREELLAMLDSANRAAMFGLEFMSLLISKDMPVQGSETMSQQLRDRVGMGTLGAMKASESWAKPELAVNNKIIARGRKTQDVNRTVDTILASATRLEKEIELETKYWSQVLALSDQKWNVCRVPRRKGVLGVNLGSSEITPVLQNRGLVALQRTDLGVEIQGNPLTAEPKTLRVRIQVKGQDTGCSKISASIPALKTSAHPVLLQARNTLFSLELWHEINREARNLGSFGIQARGQTLIFPITAEKSAVFDLISINDYTPPSSQPDDNVAQAFSLALNLMLTYAHRQTHRRRSRPQKPITNPKRITHVQAPTNKAPAIFDSPTILRAILTFLNHQTSLASLTTLFKTLTSVLIKAYYTPEPTYTITHNTPPLPPTISQTERILASLTTHLSTSFSLVISPSTTIHVNVRTTMGPLPTSMFNIGVTPENSHLSCPPPQGLFATFSDLEDFVLFWAASVVASSLLVVPTEKEKVDEVEEGWYPTYSPITLRYDTRKGLYSNRVVTFTFLRLPTPEMQREKGGRKGLKLRAVWEVQSTDEDRGGVDAKFETDSSLSGGKKMNKGEGVYDWIVWEDSKTVDIEFEDGEGEVVRNLEQIVRSASGVV